jgi:hypothetical protein
VLISHLLPKWATVSVISIAEIEGNDAGKTSQQTQGGSHQDPP